MNDFIVFLGAGASVPFALPTMTELVTTFEAKIEKELPPYLQLYKNIRLKLENCKPFDIEALLTVLQDIIDVESVPKKVFGPPSVHYFSLWGSGFDQMIEYAKQDAIHNRDKAQEMLRDVKAFIGKSCAISEQKPFEIYDEFFHQCFFKDGIDFRKSLEKAKSEEEPQPMQQCLVFTTNYDRVIESYCRVRNIAYDCGESSNQRLNIGVGNNDLFGNISLFQVFKLHGSINWYENQFHRLCWQSNAVETGATTNLGDSIFRELAIYPTHHKYTFREPYYSMFHHLKERLMHIKRCYAVGYSFRDDDILGLFHDGLELNSKLEVTLIDPKAQEIIKDRFSHFQGKVRALELPFSLNSAKNLA